jgi:methylated-DNA-protein-cysteine methyltransferase-like protein
MMVDRMRRHKKSAETSLTERIIQIIKRIPEGRVATYGQIAAMAGSPRAARQVVRTLHSSSRKEKLPWYRVVNSKGKISLLPGAGYEEQKTRLLSEGIEFDSNDTIDFKRFLWKPRNAMR